MGQTLIADRYALGDRLGSGGMSTVYRATDQVLQRTVAVKVLAEHLSDDEKFVARFRREALAVAKLVHPNIVQVYDTGVDSDRHFIVMEYIEGKSGAQLLHSRGSLDPGTAAEIAAQACSGLAYAHSQGIVHRDVKPGNLMVIGGPAAPAGTEALMTCKLTDFGIARAGEQTRLTQVGSVVGTAAYLSPEQSRGEEATPISDIYALGVVTYQLLTGRPPYQGSNLAELAMRRENERPLSPSAYNPEIHAALSAAVLMALESDPRDRYQGADEFAVALREGLAGRVPDNVTEATKMLAETSATRVMGAGYADPTTPTHPAPSRQRPPEPRAAPAPVPPPAARQSSFARTLGLFLLILIVAAIVVGLVLLFTDAGQSTDAGDLLRDTISDQLDAIQDYVSENQRSD